MKRNKCPKSVQLFTPTPSWIILRSDFVRILNMSWHFVWFCFILCRTTPFSTTLPPYSYKFRFRTECSRRLPVFLRAKITATIMSILASASTSATPIRNASLIIVSAVKMERFSVIIFLSIHDTSLRYTSWQMKTILLWNTSRLILFQLSTKDCRTSKLYYKILITATVL